MYSSPSLVLVTLVLSVFAVALRHFVIEFLDPFWGVTAVNSFACLVLGFLFILKANGMLVDSKIIFMIVAIAFCGALSTFSSYIEFNYFLFTKGDFAKLILFVLLNHGLCALSFYLGTKFNRFII